MLLPITSLYAALATLLFVRHSVAIIRLRYRHRVALLDGGNEELKRAIRVHGNFAEYIPLALLLLALLESAGLPPLALHALGVALLIGRLSHFYSVQHHEPKTGRYRFRTLGMALTFTTLCLQALLLLFFALAA